MDLFIIFFVITILSSSTANMSSSRVETIAHYQGRNYRKNNISYKDSAEINKIVDFKKEKMKVYDIRAEHLALFYFYTTENNIKREKYQNLLENIAHIIESSEFFNNGQYVIDSDKEQKNNMLIGIMKYFAKLHEKDIYFNKIDMKTNDENMFEEIGATKTESYEYQLYEWFMNRAEIQNMYLVYYSANINKFVAEDIRI
ncbi:putative SP-containing protein [Vairimorpha necatrix]|uniref:SP-containing protein n=1 Tax=Vairimorpha necatrix TaxID=6039 RepID=A0AAX4JF09_9MICR